MAEIPELSREGAAARHGEPLMAASDVNAWFVREVLPLEAALMQFLQHNWRNKSDIADLRQEVYVRVFEAARKEIPDRPRQFVFSTARNLLIDHVRREQVIPIEAVADLDAITVAMDAPSPERAAMGRDELRKLQSAIDRLPERCREAFVLGKVQGLGGREIAQRMGVTESTISKQLAFGIRALADMLHGEPPRGEKS
jgi:RNA polymerase sigma factor (sigma-70 family)